MFINRRISDNHLSGEDSVSKLKKILRNTSWSSEKSVINHLKKSWVFWKLIWRKMAKWVIVKAYIQWDMLTLEGNYRLFFRKISDIYHFISQKCIFRKSIAHFHWRAMMIPGFRSIIVPLDTRNPGWENSLHHFAQTINQQKPWTVKFHQRNHFVIIKVGHEETQIVQDKIYKVCY